MHSLAQFAQDTSYCIGGNLNDGLFQVHSMSDGGFVTAGFSFSALTGQHGGSDAFITRYDSSGSIIWQRLLGGSFNEIFYRFKPVDSSFVFTGYASSINGNVTGLHGMDDGWVMKIKETGITQWKKCFGGSQVDGFKDLIKLPDGGLLLVGYTFSSDGDVVGYHGPGNNWADAWIVRTDSQRNIIWQRCWGGSNADAAYAAVTLANGDFIVACMSNSIDGDITTTYGNRDIWLLKFDSTGTLLRQQNFGGSYDEAPTAMAITGNGNLIVTGYSFSADGNLTGNYFNGTTNWEDGWIFETDTAFQLIRQKNIGGTGSDVINNVKLIQGDYFLIGESNSTDYDRSIGALGFKDVWLIILDSSFQIQHQQSFGGNFNDFGFNLETDQQNRLLVSGFTASSNACSLGNSDGIVLRLIPTAISGTTTIETVNEKMAIQYLHEERLLRFLPALESRSTIKIFTVTGRLIYTISLQEGVSHVTIPAFDQGIYLITSKNKKSIRRSKFFIP